MQLARQQSGNNPLIGEVPLVSSGKNVRASDVNRAPKEAKRRRQGISQVRDTTLWVSPRSAPVCATLLARPVSRKRARQAVTLG